MGFIPTGPFIDAAIVETSEYLLSMNVSLEDLVFGPRAYYTSKTLPVSHQLIFGWYSSRVARVNTMELAGELASRFLQASSVSARRNILAVLAFTSLVILAPRRAPRGQPSYPICDFQFLQIFSSELRKGFESWYILDAQTKDLLINNISIFRMFPQVSHTNSGVFGVFGAQDFTRLVGALERVYAETNSLAPMLATVMTARSVILMLDLLFPDLYPDTLKGISEKDVLDGVQSMVNLIYSVYDSLGQQRFRVKYDPHSLLGRLSYRHIVLPQDSAVKLLRISSFPGLDLRQVLGAQDVISASAVKSFIAEYPKVGLGKRFKDAVTVRTDLTAVYGKDLLDLSRLERLAAATSGSLSEAGKLAYDPAPEIRARVAIRADLTPELQMQLAGDEDPLVVQYLAGSMNSSGSRLCPDVVKVIANHPSSVVRSQLAKSLTSETATYEIVEKLSGDVSGNVQNDLLLNINIPNELFGEQAALNFLTDPHVQSTTVHEVAERCQITDKVLKMLYERAAVSGVSRFAIQYRASMNLGTDPKILERLYIKNPKGKLARFITRNPSAPDEIKVLGGIID